jgi:type II secretory pathway pseudopilin PulG
MTERKGERGVTLVESLIAVGILGLAMLSLSTMLFTTVKISNMAKDHATARFLAAQRIEQIKNARYLDGDRDAWKDPSDPCTDIDEILQTNFPDEDYGSVDLKNGTAYSFRSCAATPDIKNGAVLFDRSDYPNTDQGRHDYAVNHSQYDRFRREVYIVDSADYSNAIENITLDGPRPNVKDNVTVHTVAPSADNPATNYIKYVLVRVKWKDHHGHVHHVTLSTEKAFYIPSF